MTTAAPYRRDLGEQGPGAAYNAAAKFFRVFRTPASPPPDLRISHLGYDRGHTAAVDANTWLPLAALTRAVNRDAIGSLGEDVIGLPTDRSQHNTCERDAPAVLDACRDMRCDVALLVPT
ncbi:MAG: hypothetical protein HC809_13190 [Gammaproteobacteria bacterium]|nr:hypothetical protein [Gammaproteobacteria bacterium]